MNLQEMFEAAKARWPKSKIDVSRHLSTIAHSEEWYWIQVCDEDKYSGPSAIGGTPEQALEGLIVPDRIAIAHKMIEDANKILAEEGQPIPFAVLSDNSGGE